MANPNPVSTNGQYTKYSYTYGGTTYNNIHVFKTKAQSMQSIAPAISETKVALSNINPAPIAANKVIAKTNGCMFDYSTSNFYGFFYQGKNYPMYIYATKFYSVPESTAMYSEKQFWPSFCVKSNGTAAIRWFESASDLRTALNYCDCVIGSVHPLVFDGKCVLTQKVYDNEPSHTLIYDPQNPYSTNNRFKFDAGSPFGDANRTLLGHLQGVSGYYFMVCTDSKMSLEVAANFMKALNCDYAVAMDGGTPYEMRIKAGYGPSGKVTSGSGYPLNTAVCAYEK